MHGEKIQKVFKNVLVRCTLLVCKLYVYLLAFCDT